MHGGELKIELMLRLSAHYLNGSLHGIDDPKDSDPKPVAGNRGTQIAVGIDLICRLIT